MLPIQIYLSHFNLSSLIHLVPAGCFDVLQWPDSWVHGHLCDVLSQPDSLAGQQYLAIVWQPRWVYLCTASCSASIAATTPTEHLPPSMSQYRDKVLAIFLIQQCLKPAGWLSPLQTDSIHLLLQQFLQLVV